MTALHDEMAPLLDPSLPTTPLILALAKSYQGSTDKPQRLALAREIRELMALSSSLQSERRDEWTAGWDAGYASGCSAKAADAAFKAERPA